MSPVRSAIWRGPQLILRFRELTSTNVGQAHQKMRVPEPEEVASLLPIAQGLEGESDGLIRDHKSLLAEPHEHRAVKKFAPLSRVAMSFNATAKGPDLAA